jgi:hypothetical protein
MRTALLSRKKGSLSVLAVYLALAVTGTVTFGLSDSFDTDIFEQSALISEGFFTSDYALDYLAEGTGVLSKAGSYSFSPMRNTSQRVEIPFEPECAGTLFSHLSLKLMEKINCFDAKNAIRVNLRI